MQKIRESGILMPISSLPSPYGIGTLGKAAYEFADFLKKSGCSLWQVLPIGPTGYGDSPYQSFSVFAGNPYFIDLDTLINEKLLKKSDCEHLENPDFIDYHTQYQTRFDVLKTAFSRFNKNDEKYQKFLKKQQFWIDDYALFMAMKNHFGGKEWLKWGKISDLSSYREKLKNEIDFQKFLQFMFYKQWSALKKYCNKQGVKIIGDIPIYTALDSLDVYFSKKLFQLDKDNKPTAVAGCPPDAFSEDGQLWGNPLYDYKYHKKTGYKWWIKRIKHALKLYDIVRIDHFRGFESYYSIPYGEKTAKNGRWVKGPDYDLFKKAKRKLGGMNIIAEDLGFIDEKVQSLLDKTGFAGMKVLQFAFGDDNRNKYLPHEYGYNHIVYTGTHDNQTTRAWFDECDKKTKKYICEYLNCDEKSVVSALIRTAIASTAKYAVIPMADILQQGKEGRINTPSTLGDNWVWRIGKRDLSDTLAKSIRVINETYGRV